MNYPAYNGQFSGVIFSTNLGVFQSEEAAIDKLIEAVKRPD